MSYMALYRKFRPVQFDEVKGQEHIVTTLRNQIKTGRIGHAYLFCGTRGTGKTTVAKLFAKAVNCEHPIDGNPCMECASCRAIAEQSSMNVMEIDAASNNGVDNIREIREQVQYSPAEGRYKVFIIDEVHMLSIGAFNALLKTLEEPPEYVIFILATTEPQKIPITILSRCQRYDFRRITIETIYNRLAELMNEEQVQAEAKALRYVAKMGDGSMRDALSLLDQCVAFYLGEELTYERVLDVLGASDISIFQHLLELLLAQDVTTIMSLVEKIILEGKELNQFISDFIWYLRNLLLVKSSDDLENVLDMSAENIAQLKQTADGVEMNQVMHYIQVLSELSNKLRYATDKRVLVELSMIGLCRPQMSPDGNRLEERLRQLEKKMEEQQNTPVQVKIAESVAKPEQQPDFNPEEELQKKFPPAEVEELKQLVRQIKTLKGKVNPPMWSYLEMAALTVGESGHSINLVFQQDGDGKTAREYFERELRPGESNLKELQGILSREIEKEVTLHCLFAEEKPRNNFDNYDLRKLNIPVEFE